MLEFELKLDAERFKPGKPVPGKLVLRNAGDEPMLVNGRLVINKPFAPAPFRDVYFNLVNPAGEQAEFLLKINVGEPGSQDFTELAPGESAERPFELDTYYLLEQPGTYAVQATYESHAEPPDGRQAWTGKLDAARITFELA